MPSAAPKCLRSRTVARCVTLRVRTSCCVTLRVRMSCCGILHCISRTAPRADRTGERSGIRRRNRIRRELHCCTMRDPEGLCWPAVSHVVMRHFDCTGERSDGGETGDVVSSAARGADRAVASAQRMAAEAKRDAKQMAADAKREAQHALGVERDGDSRGSASTSGHDGGDAVGRPSDGSQGSGGDRPRGESDGSEASDGSSGAPAGELLSGITAGQHASVSGFSRHGPPVL